MDLHDMILQESGNTKLWSLECYTKSIFRASVLLSL